jgi:L-fuculose-phosphate aldolase
MSVRLGERIIITRRGSQLGCLEEHDLIETGIRKNDRNTPLASTELATHRAIYQATPALAIVHAHPPHAVALSLVETEIVPNDTEGRDMMPRILVVGWNMQVKPGGLADVISHALKPCRIVVAYGHGSFAIGQLLEEAHNCTTMLEASCRVICLFKSLNVNPGEKLA